MKKLFIMLMMVMVSLSACAQKPQKATNSKEQCTAITQKNVRCKLKVVKGEKYCSTHLGKETKVVQCKATTQKGVRCTRPAVKGKYGYCTQHYNNKKK